MLVLYTHYTHCVSWPDEGGGSSSPDEYMTVPNGGRPSNEANWLAMSLSIGCYLLHHRHYLVSLSPNPNNHSTVPWRIEGWVVPDTAVRVYNPCPRLYITVVFVTQTVFVGIWSCDLIHRSRTCCQSPTTTCMLYLW